MNMAQHDNTNTEIIRPQGGSQTQAAADTAQIAHTQADAPTQPQGYAFDFAQQQGEQIPPSQGYAPQNGEQPFTTAANTAQPNMGGNGVPNNPQGGQMPMNGGAPGNRGTATLRGKPGGKTIGIIAAISLGCGLVAGIAGTAVTNAIYRSNEPSHSNMMMRGIGDRGFGEGDGDGESMPDFGSGNGSRNRRSYRADGQMPGMQDSDGANGESNGDARNRSQSNDSDSNAARIPARTESEAPSACRHLSLTLSPHPLRKEGQKTQCKCPKLRRGESQGADAEENRRGAD